MLPAKKFSHCHFCGAAYPAAIVEADTWPRTCLHCQQTTFRNPLPVAVLLLPVEMPTGGRAVLTVRRGIPPREGALALPGGYLEVGESWQVGGARELWEEAGVRVDPAGVRVFEVMSAPDSTLLVFGLATAVSYDTLPPFMPTAEASERVLVDEPIELAFPLHTEVLRRYFG